MSSAGGLPDQNEANRAQHGAISGPLDLIEHEACLRPSHQPGALTDPQKTDGKCEQAQNQQRSAHGLSPLARPIFRSIFLAASPSERRLRKASRRPTVAFD